MIDRSEFRESEQDVENREGGLVCMFAIDRQNPGNRDRTEETRERVGGKIGFEILD